MSRFIKSTNQEVTVSVNPNATGVVGVWAHEDSTFQEAGVQGYFSPAEARKIALDLLAAADAVDEMNSRVQAYEPPF